jgi:hypothetical protein
MRALAFLLACLAVLTFAVAKPQQSGFLDNLRSAEGVMRVERLVSVPQPACRIIHIADYHWISMEDLAVDLRDQVPNVTDADIEDEYRRITSVARRVQANQLRFIRWLSKRHGVRIIHLEGLTDNDVRAYAALARLVKKGTLEPFRLGAAGQALIAGDIEAVAPVEDEAAFTAANPLTDDGVTLEGPGNESREAAIVRRLAASGPLAVVVLGAAHDLSSDVEELGDCEYLKVYVDGVEH